MMDTDDGWITGEWMCYLIKELNKHQVAIPGFPCPKAHTSRELNSKADYTPATEKFQKPSAAQGTWAQKIDQGKVG